MKLKHSFVIFLTLSLLLVPIITLDEVFEFKQWAKASTIKTDQHVSKHPVNFIIADLQFQIGDIIASVSTLAKSNITNKSVNGTDSLLNDNTSAKNVMVKKNRVNRFTTQYAYSSTNPGLIDVTITALDSSNNKVWERIFKNIPKPDESLYMDVATPDIELKYIEKNDALFLVVGGTFYKIDLQTGVTKFSVRGVGQATEIFIDTDGSIYLSGYAGPMMAKIDADGNPQWKIINLPDF